MSDKYIIDNVTLVNPTRPTMYGKYRIIGVDEQNIVGGLVVKQLNEQPTQVAVRTAKEGSTTTTFTVNEHISLSTNLFVKQHGKLDIHGRLTVRPKRAMYGLYDVIEPPDLLARIYPSQDTYVRDDRPRVSYGKEPSIIFGNYYGRQYKSLVQYDIPSFKTNGTILDAKLVFVTDSALENFNASIHLIRSEWNETDTTWVNAPAQGELVQTFPVGGLGRFELDITEQYLKWYNGAENFGLYITKDDVTTVGTRSYSSHESPYSHYIEVRYKDPFVYSYNNLRNRWSFTVRPYTDIKGKLEVNAVDFYKEALTTLYVTDPSNVNSQIDVQTPNLLSKVDVKYRGSKSWSSSLIVPYEELHDHEGRVEIRAVSASSLQSKLNVVLNTDIDTALNVRPTASLAGEVGVRADQDTEIPTSLVVNHTTDLQSSLYVHDYMDERGKLSVRAATDTDNPSTLAIHHTTEIFTQFHVHIYEDNQSTVAVRVIGETDTPSSLTVNEWADIASKILVHEVSDMVSSLRVQQFGDSDWHSILDTVMPNDINTTLLPRLTGKYEQLSHFYVQSPFLVNQLKVKRTGVQDLLHHLIVRAPGNMDTASKVQPRVTRNLDTRSALTVRVTTDKDIITHFYIRATDVDDLFLKLQVDGGVVSGNYVFIM